MAAVALVTLWGAPRALAGDAASPVVVELFTSQGCSSCPPADALLGELAQRDDLIALAFHVDYWDYIGWKDPFASPDFTRRQRDYAAALGSRTIYTPQMVIDGSDDAVGSDRGRVGELIRRAAARPRLELALDSSGGKHVLILPQAQLERPATVWLAVYDREERTSVRRGENAGRDLSDYNIVRHFRKVAGWDGTPGSLELDLSEAMQEGMGCAVLVQAEGQGQILAALKVLAGDLRESTE